MVEASSDWIEWAGGDAPVPDGTRGMVQFRDETRDGVDREIDLLDGLDWQHENQNWDIIAYRVVQA